MTESTQPVGAVVAGARGVRARHMAVTSSFGACLRTSIWIDAQTFY